MKDCTKICEYKCQRMLKSTFAYAQTWIIMSVPEIIINDTGLKVKVMMSSN